MNSSMDTFTVAETEGEPGSAGVDGWDDRWEQGWDDTLLDVAAEFAALEEDGERHGDGFDELEPDGDAWDDGADVVPAGRHAAPYDDEVGTDEVGTDHVGTDEVGTEHVATEDE